MEYELKPDANKFAQYIDKLCQSDWLGNSRKWWPQFIYHFTNIDNAVQILKSGKLYSRSKLEKIQGMITDNASPSVIENTDEVWKNYVRLYFRPRTPTQHVNEGYRPRACRELGAHCPIPVYFLFNSKKLLARKSVKFSYKSLALRETKVYTDFTDFKRIPFELVYHDSWFPPEDRDIIVQHRHAEVIVPYELNLEDLSYVWCRSEAEYRTFINLLSSETRKKWINNIGAGKKGNFFFREWFFVDSVILSRESILFKFNLPAQSFEETFHLKLQVEEIETGKIYYWEDENFSCEDDSLRISLSNLKNPDFYKVKLLCDEQLMYFDEYCEKNNLPF